MKGFFAWLFSENTSSMHITLFSIWHFFYLALILGGTALLAVRIRKKEKREKLLRIMAYTVIGLYVADFFIMPLSDSYGIISTEKLPFHICTLMGVVVPFVQFNKKLAFARTPVVFLSVAASIVWMCYPGSALGGQPPFCYRTFQTFMYHGVLFCWGVLNLAYGAVTPNIKKCWKELCGILMIYVWAWFGNTVYGGFNWFFIETSIVPMLPDAALPPVVVGGVFLVCLLIYGIYYGVRALASKKERQVA